MIGDADGVLSEGGVVVGIRMRGGLTKILQIVVRDCVGVRAKRTERKSRFHGCKGEGIDLDGIKEILAALLAGEEIVDPGEKRVAAKLEGVAGSVEAQGFGEVQSVLTRRTGEQVGAADRINDGWNLDQSVSAVCIGLLQVARELSSEMA